MKVFCTGDTHGDPISRLGSTRFPEGTTLTKEDVIVVAGDFGVIWDGRQTPQERYILNWLDSKPFTLAFVKGNHENHERLNSSEFPTEVRWGAPVKRISRSVYMLETGYVYQMGSCSILAIGGATSTDKQLRIDRISWWQEEVPSFEETRRIFERDRSVDYIVSHTCPTHIASLLGRADRLDDPVTKMLSQVFEEFTFKQWYFGHMHEDAPLPGNFTACYHKVHFVGGS